jgi:hypothetical protein
MLTSFYFQICGNVKSNYDSCTIPSPANIYNTTDKTCTPVGDINSYAWGINPSSNEGVDLFLYHGANRGAVGTYQTRIYFECSQIYVPNASAPKPFPNETLIWEHFNPVAGNGGSYHLTINTKYACPASVLPPTASSSTSSTSTSPASFVAPSFIIVAAVASALFFM